MLLVRVSLLTLSCSVDDAVDVQPGEITVPISAAVGGKWFVFGGQIQFAPGSAASSAWAEIPSDIAALAAFGPRPSGPTMDVRDAYAYDPATNKCTLTSVSFWKLQWIVDGCLLFCFSGCLLYASMFRPATRISAVSLPLTGTMVERKLGEHPIIRRRLLVQAVPVRVRVRVRVHARAFNAANRHAYVYGCIF